MASEFLVDGDLFVEVVDNSDGGGIPPERFNELLRAYKEDRFDEVAFPFERSNGYNGVRQLYSRRGPRENIFGTAWSSSLNFETVYDAAGDRMTPRWMDGRLGSPPTPSKLIRIRENSVRLELSVPAPDRIDVATTFTLVAPHYLDLETAIKAHPGSFQGEWLGLFWANYIHGPEKKTTYFRARRGPEGSVEWIAMLAEAPPTKRVFAGEDELKLLPGEPDAKGGLFHNVRPSRFVEPVFYGRWRNMMLEMMFETDQNLRFAIQPTGGGAANPAWDFAIVIPRCRPLETYKWKARVVFKPFVNSDDVWQESKKWTSSRGDDR